MATPQAATLLERARNGERLSAKDRRHVLTYLMMREQMTNEELAELFQVSKRQVQFDKERIKQEVAKGLKTEDIALVIADIRLAFEKNMRDIEKGKEKATLGTRTYLDYCNAAFKLQMDYVKGMQDLGIYPKELGTMHVEEFKFIASVGVDTSAGSRPVDMFDKKETPVLDAIEVAPKELPDGKNSETTTQPASDVENSNVQSNEAGIPPATASS